MEYDRHKLSRSRRWRVWGVALAILAIVVSIGLLWAFSGNKANLESSAAAPASTVPAYKTYHGRYVTFTYKGGYSVKQVHSPNPDVELALLRDDTTYEKTLALTVQPTGSGGIAADTGYYFRQTHPDLYSSQQVTVDGAAATEWTRADGTEQTIYIPHGNDYAVLAFSLSETNDTSGLPSEVTAVLQSFHWK